MRSSTLRSSRVLAINDGDRLGHNTKVEDHWQPYTKMTTPPHRAATLANINVVAARVNAFLDSARAPSVV